ncbi:Histidyl-tRNA synthetase [Hordeum vulgare]|nr:Histidyl-tRNA synthetase [Hordeum vulgare]
MAVSRKCLRAAQAELGAGMLSGLVESMRASSPTHARAAAALAAGVDDEHAAWMARHPSALAKFEETLDKTIGNLETELPAARTLQESFLNGSPVSQEYKAFESSGRHKYLMIISINTAFSSCKRRDSIRNTWMPQGEKRKKLEEEKGVIIRFVICHSAISGGIVDRAIATEDRKHGDFMRLVSLNLSALLTVISRPYKKVVSHTRGNCQYPRSEAFKRHLARVPDFLWISEDGIKVQLGKLSREEIEKELISSGLSSEAVQGIIEVLSLKSLDKLEEVLGSGVEVVADLKKLFSFAEQYGYADWICFDASVVRGLAYYTGIVFEAFDREGELRAICNYCLLCCRVFKHAERINASRLILVGKSEWERGMVRVKILSTREEFEVKAGELQ